MSKNIINLVGTISANPEYSHSVNDEKFFSTSIIVKRKSGNADVINLNIPETILDKTVIKADNKVALCGSIRTHNYRDENEVTHTVTSMFVIDAFEWKDDNEDRNCAELEGVICKEPIFRKTPGGREICEICLAVDRNYGKSDYLHIIFWGRSAGYVSRKYNIHSEISLIGRLQSREYTKKFEDGTSEIRVAYEVSATKLVEEDAYGKEQ